MARINQAHGFARPLFRVVDSRWASPRQASFSPYSSRWISDPPNLTFGRTCYLFEVVAPHPNCLPTVVHLAVLAVRTRKGAVSSVPRNLIQERVRSITISRALLTSR